MPEGVPISFIWWADRRQNAVYSFFLPFIFSAGGNNFLTPGGMTIFSGGYHAGGNGKTAGG